MAGIRTEPVPVVTSAVVHRTFGPDEEWSPQEGQRVDAWHYTEPAPKNWDHFWGNSLRFGLKQGAPGEPCDVPCLSGHRCSDRGHRHCRLRRLLNWLCPGSALLVVPAPPLQF